MREQDRWKLVGFQRMPGGNLPAVTWATGAGVTRSARR